MEWHNYRVSLDDYDLVIEAPNEGAAIEYYLACRGMMYYDEPPTVERTVDPPQECRVFVEKVFDAYGWDDARWQELQTHHTWRTP